MKDVNLRDNTDENIQAIQAVSLYIYKKKVQKKETKKISEWGVKASENPPRKVVEPDEDLKSEEGYFFIY